jgi:hypothetical protein
MSSADKSASGRIRMLKAETLAVYYKSNPTVREFGGQKPSSSETVLLRKVGTEEKTCNCSAPAPAPG